MNKKLEEAIRVIKENQEDRKKVLESKAFDEYITEVTQQDYDRNQAILNYIDNSISTEVIEEKIEELEKQREEADKEDKIGTGIVLTGGIRYLEELLEQK